MSTLGILSLIFGVILFALLILNILFHSKMRWLALCMTLALPLMYVVYSLITVFWIREVYASDDVKLATIAAILAMLFLGTIVLFPFLGRIKRPFIYVNLACFVLLGVATIVSFIYLSKSVMQPNAAIVLFF